MHQSIITLLTDFGTVDHYVAAMKGVILQIAPRATIVDISHDIAPQDITRGAFMLRQIWKWYPPGTVHVAVIDPGVGSARRIIAGKFGGQFVVAPDNGLISLVYREVPVEALHIVDNRKHMLPHISSTFHGRDILSPAAAHLCNGVALSSLGPATATLEILQTTTPQRHADGGLVGRVMFADRFGNLVTNITRTDLLALCRQRNNVQAYLGDQNIGPIRATYSEAPPGEPIALLGSSDHLEIAVNQGNAANALAAPNDATVHVR